MPCACATLGQLEHPASRDAAKGGIEQMSQGLRKLDAGRTQRAFLVFIACAVFWIVIVWLCTRFI